MARKLKVYTTAIGFFELAIATPSMKAASEAWGADTDIFRRGFARQTDDPAIVKAAMAKPGIVLRRAVGSEGAFKEHSALPKKIDAGPVNVGKKPVRQAANDAGEDKKAARAAALAYEKEEARRQAEQRKEEARRKREAEHRQRARAKADAELERARKHHEERLAAIERRRKELDAEADAEERQWRKARDRHKEAIDRTGS